jgi:hypothetical protein
MVSLYVFRTKIYHFLANRLQFEQITNLYPIDSETDRWVPFVSSEVAKTGDYLLTGTRSHMSVHLKENLEIRKKKVNWRPSSPTARTPA